MNQPKPPSAPSCWGLKYQDGERECEQCRFVDSCRPTMLARITGLPSDNKPTTFLPMRTYPQQPALPPPPSSYQQRAAATIVPLPPKPYVAPSVSQIPMPPRPAQTVTTTPAPQQNPYYQPTTGYSLPNPLNPNPMAPMHRPGAPAPAYYMTQYPGERVGTRVAKNAVLRALEAVFGELMQFFRHWTWPPSP